MRQTLTLELSDQVYDAIEKEAVTQGKTPEQIALESVSEHAESKASQQGTPPVEAVSEESSDFFSLAGLWTERGISLESIRQKAWPRQNI